ncbi:MAG: NAD(P)/FAD-dependent oxidoreductase [Myxococcota bacterium]|nr:NAD(P)/FAD-dependent oxidoreductase [Myxococcota bacterium]
MGEDLPIAIIGSGFAGIGAAIQLKKAGIDSFTIFERADEIGGTWRDNTYPGAACDVPSHVYAFSFEQKPDWSRAFAESSEIQAYLLALVEKWKLRPHLRLNTEIVDARFDETSASWTLTTDDDSRVTARVVISGVGVKQEVQDAYNARIQGRMKHMVWSKCESWYLNPDGSNHALYPGFAAEYSLRARKFNPRDYETVR